MKSVNRIHRFLLQFNQMASQLFFLRVSDTLFLCAAARARSSEGTVFVFILLVLFLDFR